MNRLKCLGASAALALSCAFTARAQNIEGQIIAAQYGTWRVQGIPQPTTGNSFNFVAAARSQIAGNKTFQPFQVGTPIEIFDADPNQNEAVTPSAVSATNQGCSITASPVHTHNSFSLGSATAGLQEAINANTTTTGNTIVLTAEWYRHGGSSGIITSVQGTTALNLVDVTKAPYDWYAWNGSVYVKIALGGGSIPHTNDILAGFGDGSAVAVPELGTTPVAGSPNTATIAYATDNGLGVFDCRSPQYDGGCLGPTPGLALQDLANDLICYNTSTGLKATVYFPPGTFSVGTDSQPTLKFPTGNSYIGEAGITGTATIFHAGYNNHGAVEFDGGLTATCSGTVKTDTLTDGKYEALGEHGCAQGGCINVPGDSVNYGTGGPAQTGIVIADSQGWVDRVGAAENGADGLMVNGIDTHTGNLWGNANNAYRIFGRTVGPTYDPSTDGIHCSICLNSLDGIFSGPNETYGFTPNPGPEYGNVVEVFVGGGMTQAHQIFVNRGQIGLQRGLGDGSSFAGHITNVRIDGTTGAGIRAEGANDYFTDATVTGPCSAANVAWSSVGTVTIATPGSGQTDGTYNLTGSGGLATTGGLDGNGGATGVNAVIQVVVAGGIATTVTVTNPGQKYSVPGANPTFTMTAGARRRPSP
jgi:hypothetical protein